MSQEVILLLAANPKTTTRVRVDEEQNRIRRAHERAKLRDHFRIEHVPSASQADIRRALLDHEPYIVQFSGHGTRDAEIVIVKDDGSPHLVGYPALGPFFEVFSSHVRCVVLSSCYSRPLAAKIGEYVDYVVGMRDEVQDDLVMQYAVAFYDALFAGKNIPEAHRLGCNAILFAGLPGYLKPVLHIADGASTFAGSEVQSEVQAVVKLRIETLLSEVSRLYSRPRSAEALLSKIGFPRDRMPLFDARNAAEFWDEVRTMLVDGVIEGVGLERLLQEARSDFPGNETLNHDLDG